MAVQPAMTAARAPSEECAWTTDHSPWAVASPQAAVICSGVMVILPPSRMLAVANSFTTSAPPAFIWRTNWRIWAASPVFSLSCRREVSRRGPGMAPEAIWARRSASSSAPKLCTVVKPLIRVAWRLAAGGRAACWGFHLAHELADLGGVARVLIKLPQGGKQAGSGDGAGGDLGAQIGVEFRAQTLHRGETAHQGGVEIGRGGEGRLLGRRFSAAAALLQASVRIEIPGGVDVGIDPTGHHRHAGQIDGCLTLGIADCGNPSAFDDEIGILQDMSPTVEQGRCADHYSLPIGECGAKYQNPQALHRVPAYRRCTLKYGQETRQASQAPGCPRPRARQGFGARCKNPRTDRSRPRSQPPGPEP